jgi:hypothetical protein
VRERPRARGGRPCASLANDLTGAARGGTGFDSCVLAAIEGNEFVVVSQIEPPVRTEKQQRTEVRSRRLVRSQPRHSRSSRWVHLSRRDHLKWTRRDGTLTFDIRGARKSGPTARTHISTRRAICCHRFRLVSRIHQPEASARDTAGLPVVSPRRAFPGKPASLGGNRPILLWFGPRLSVSPVEPVIGP